MGPNIPGSFADRTNHQVNQYVSWRPDPSAVATDAFSVKWGNHAAYAFPPFCLIGRCLSKIAKDKCGLIMITPLWQTANWWPLTLQMSTMDPILLLKTQKMITGPQGESHPLVETNMLSLVVWKVVTVYRGIVAPIGGCMTHSSDNNESTSTQDGDQHNSIVLGSIS